MLTEQAASQPTKLSFWRYGVFAAVGLVLSALQLLLLPRWLSERDFGLVVLAISATQAVLQFGDLGFVRLSIDGTCSAEERARRRTQGQAITLASAALALLVLLTIAMTSTQHRQLAIALALGVAAGAFASGDKFRAAEREVAGDEVTAAGLNFLWANVPKAGLLIGAALFAEAPLVLVMSAVAAAAVCLPYVEPMQQAAAGLRRTQLWLYPFGAIIGGFLLTWADTYFLAARLGISGAAGYEALYRILGACTYVALPWVSVAASRVSSGAPRPLRRPLVSAAAMSAATLTVAVAFVYSLAPDVFPNLRLPREAVPGLVVFYLLLPLAYCLGIALYVRDGQVAVTRGTLAALAVCLVGHAVFTLRGGPAEAAAVDAASIAVAVVAFAIAYRRRVAGLERRAL